MDKCRAQMPAQAGRVCVITSCPQSGLLHPDTVRAHHQEGGRRERPEVALPRSWSLGRGLTGRGRTLPAGQSPG